MKSRIAFPTLTLPDDCVDAPGWQTANADAVTITLGQYLPDWDYATSIPLRRNVRLDWALVAEALDCGRDVVLACVLRVGTGMGRLPRSIIHQVKVELSADQPEACFDFTLHGDRLSSVLDLTIDIILDRPSERSTALSPVRRGSRLWHDSVRIRLEGEEPRFPVEVADFDTLLGGSIAARSPWYLHWSPRDWSRDFHGSMRLYLNSRHTELIRRFEREDEDVLRGVMAEVMGQVCEALLRDADTQASLDDLEEGTLGCQAKHWIKLAFPSVGVDQARGVLESRPGEFRAAFQAVADMSGTER